MTTIKCPHCNKQSYGMAYCDHCGEEIPRNSNTNQPQPEKASKSVPRFNASKLRPIKEQTEPVVQQPVNDVQNVQQPVQQPIYIQPQPQMGGIMCPKCKQRNVSVQLIQTAAKTKHNSRGCLWELGRLFLIFCTCGLWLIIGRSKGKSKTKIKNDKMCVCQNCGYSWKA